MQPIYLDHNATTPLAPEVLEAMLPVLRENFGNPSSIHAMGRAARVALDEARDRVAALIGAHASEIVFTSGGTESDNLAVLGVARAQKNRGRHVVTTRIEHPAVLNPCRQLEKEGFQVDYLSVEPSGRLDPEALSNAIRHDTVLVSVQHANSEIGTLQDIETLGRIVRDRGTLFHCDAVQTVGKIPVDARSWPVDLVSLSAHKMYGPKGAGALYIRRGTPALEPLIWGGGQEKKRRGGTENVAAVVGFGAAAELASSRLAEDGERVRRLRDHLRKELGQQIPGVTFHGHPVESLPNTLSVAFEGINGQSLLIRLDVAGIAVSTGTACSSGATQPSEVLAALGIPEESIQGTLRLSLGRGTTEEEVNRVIVFLADAVQAVRSRNPEVAVRGAGGGLK